MPRYEGVTDEMIIEKYNNGERASKIADFCGLSARAVRNVIYKSGIDNIKRPRKYHVNEDFFKTWTSNMAYVLGFVLTDGCVTKSPDSCNTNLQIIQNDTDILKDILKAMDSEHKITKDPRSKNTHRVFINSVVIVDDLIKMGVTPRKSLTATMPTVPMEYIFDFLRGVIDGDGHISTHRKNYEVSVATGSETFANQLSDTLAFLGFSSARIRYSSVYRVIVSGVDDVRELYDRMYADPSCLHIKRKKLTLESI